MPMWKYIDNILVRGWLEIELRGEDKELIYKHRQPVKSFVANWTKALYGLMYDDCRSKAVTLRDTGGTDRAYPNLSDYYRPIFKVTAPAGNTEYGILFGYGTASKTINDYFLGALITHGTGANQLDYADTGITWEIADDRGILYISRTASNYGSDDVTITEVGLAFYEADVDYYELYFLILADLLDTSVVVSPSLSITARYKFEFLF